MLALFLFAVLSGIYATTMEKFKEKGLQYEEFGRARLMLDREQCHMRKLNMSSYVNSAAEDEVSDVDGIILKTKLQNTFANVCHRFNLSSDAPPLSESIKSLQEASGYLDRFRLRWTVQKFENDLRSLFLYNKISAPFFRLVDEKWLDDDLDVFDFAAAAVVFPASCDLTEMVVNALVCSNFEEQSQQGILYAIVHAGQFMPENQAFVFYEVPEYVIVVEDGDEIVAIEFESCKVMNGTTFVCTERAHGECDITTMDSCDIFAQSTATNFTYIRNYGSGKIVATNLSEVNVTGVIVRAASPIFTHHTSYEMENDGNEPKLVAYAKIVPVANEISFPSMSHGASDAVRSSKGPVRLHRLTRKGIPILSHQPGKASVWDDVRDFFLHLI